MSIKKLTIKKFTAFEDLAVQFSPGINVIIGANSSGKSHLMKLAYALARVLFEGDPTTLSTRLMRLFRPDELGRLVWRARGRRSAHVTATFSSGSCGFSLSNLGKLTPSISAAKFPPRPVFLPSRELLAMYDGFVDAYQKRELSFDETYFDGCVALSGAALRGPRSDVARSLAGPIEEALGGSVSLVGKKFYVRDARGNLEAHLLSEGLRKIASLAQLVINGSLQLDSTGILFWDEPEANLNPRLIAKVVDFLLAIARTGAQVILATHDQLLTQRLALANTYPEGKPVPMKFIALTRDAAGSVRSETADHLADLKENPILDEFARFYEDEGKALSHSLGGTL